MSVFLEKIVFPLSKHGFCRSYPANVVSSLGRNAFEFSPITILYGSNGSGKSTVLNLIAEKIRCQRKTLFDHNPAYDFDKGRILSLFDEIASNSSVFTHNSLPWNCQFITSAEVLNYVDHKLAYSNMMSDNILQAPSYIDDKSWQDEDGNISEGAEYLKKLKAKENWAQQVLMEKSIFSNGEEMLAYFMNRIDEDGLYLLDEPENCLSPVFQKLLSNKILEVINTYECQFIIATHSPFFLSLENAKIYNLDKTPVSDNEKWYNLANMQPYFELFNDSAYNERHSG